MSAVVDSTEPDPRRHRAREGVWAHAAMLSDSVAAFPALDPRPPSLPWIHAAVLSERGREGAMDPHRRRWWGPWIRVAGDSCREDPCSPATASARYREGERQLPLKASRPLVGFR